MSSTPVTLQPGQSHTFKDHEGGTDLVIQDPNDGAGSFTYAVNSGPAKAHTLNGHGTWYTEVADMQSGTVQNTGSVSLNAKFG